MKKANGKGLKAKGKKKKDDRNYGRRRDRLHSKKCKELSLRTYDLFFSPFACCPPPLALFIVSKNQICASKCVFFNTPKTGDLILSYGS
jgi:hypothetical protein